MVSVAFKNQLLLIMDFLSFILMDAIDEEAVFSGVRELKQFKTFQLHRFQNYMYRHRDYQWSGGFHDIDSSLKWRPKIQIS